VNTLLTSDSITEVKYVIQREVYGSNSVHSCFSKVLSHAHSIHLFADENNFIQESRVPMRTEQSYVAHDFAHHWTSIVCKLLSEFKRRPDAFFKRMVHRILIIPCVGVICMRFISLFHSCCDLHYDVDYLFRFSCAPRNIYLVSKISSIFLHEIFSC